MPVYDITSTDETPLIILINNENTGEELFSG
jgi:hypothetical protein